MKRKREDRLEAQLIGSKHEPLIEKQIHPEPNKRVKSVKVTSGFSLIIR